MHNYKVIFVPSLSRVIGVGGEFFAVSPSSTDEPVCLPRPDLIEEPVSVPAIQERACRVTPMEIRLKMARLLKARLFRSRSAPANVLSATQDISSNAGLTPTAKRACRTLCFFATDGACSGLKVRHCRSCTRKVSDHPGWSPVRISRPGSTRRSSRRREKAIVL